MKTPQTLRPCGLPSRGFRDLITVFEFDGVSLILYSNIYKCQQQIFQNEKARCYLTFPC